MAKRDIGRTLVHRRAVMLTSLQTKGGTKFPRGTVVMVTYAQVNGKKVSIAQDNPNPLNIFGPERLAMTDVEAYHLKWIDPPRKTREEPDEPALDERGTDYEDAG